MAIAFPTKYKKNHTLQEWKNCLDGIKEPCPGTAERYPGKHVSLHFSNIALSQRKCRVSDYFYHYKVSILKIKIKKNLLGVPS